ncbi:hypothetical protein DWY69_09900 [Eisenbergiella massiliensis]|uniref:Uncharacterized protein n=1 Tax=Eisenbergiella massiliensis TaxID=1720294 RepID=A0A3E3HZI4_9FIRM|nr:hypothetical protein DXC51_20445 [Eisenbergiella massiliensis]RGE72256.1 hypothetical protein DWY69_09900 [Eisenbergiella massiliensis]
MIYNENSCSCPADWAGCDSC